MDYIIFGMGAGATLVLVGWLFREFGPRVRDRAPAEDEVLTGSELVTRMSWARFCGTCGMALLLCGLLVLIVTGIVVPIAPDDSLGSLVVLAAFGVCVVLMLVWTGMYLRQFGTLGVIRPKPPKAEPATPLVAPVQPEPEGQEGTSPEPGVPPSFEEAAAARGGFGRFGGLLRRRPATPPEAKTMPAAVDDTTEPATAREAAPDVSATEAVIEELTGAQAEGDDKRLGLDDPLVTSVQTLAQKRAAAAVASQVSDELLPPESQVGTVADGDEANGDGRKATDAAMDTLRKRRIGRFRSGSD